jgi:hypothetical protein
MTIYHKKLLSALTAGILIIVIAGPAFAYTGPPMPPRYGERYCDQPGFHCILVGYREVERTVKTRRGRKTVTKKVRDSWKRLWPDEREREIVMKLNRMNIRLRKGMLIAVPDDMDGKTYMDFSPFPPYIERECEPTGEQVCRIMCENCESGEPVFKKVCERECIPKDELVCNEDGVAVGEKVVIIDLAQQAFAAYDEQGKLLRWGPVSGGRNWGRWVSRMRVTVVGEFRISRKYGRWAVSGLYPPAKDDKPAGGAPVPYFMRFYPGYGMHHYWEVPGRHASHGCVRLFFDDAKWLNKEFAKIGTRVVVLPYAEEDSPGRFIKKKKKKTKTR